MATNFPIDLLRRLNEPEREFVIVAHLRRQVGQAGGPTASQNQNDVHFSLDPLPQGIGRNIPDFRMIMPVAKKLGRILAFQDTGLFGNAQGSSTIETSNEPDGALWPPIFLTDSIRVSDILGTGNLIGLEARFWILAESYNGTGPEFELIGHYTLDRVDITPGNVRFRVIDRPGWERTVPMTTIDSASLGTTLIDPDDEFQGIPVPIQFGVMGKGKYNAAFDPDSAGTDAVKLGAFRGYLNPYNPAPCIGLYKTFTAHPLDPKDRTVVVYQDGGVPGTATGRHFGSLIGENLYYRTDDGRFAFVGTIAAENSFLTSIYAWTGLVEGVDIPGWNDREIHGVALDLTAERAELGIFPFVDTNTTGTNSEYNVAVLAGMGPEAKLGRSRIFSEHAEPSATLILTPGEDYAEIWGFMPEEIHHGAIASFNPFAWIGFNSGPNNETVSVQFKLNLDDLPTTMVNAVTGITAGDRKLAVLNFNVLGSGAKAHTIENWFEWRFEFERTSTGKRERGKFAVGFKLNAGAVDPVTLHVYSSGVKVEFVPANQKPLDTVRGTPIEWGNAAVRVPLWFDGRTRTRVLTENNSLARFYISTEGASDDPNGTATGVSLSKVSNPVEQMHLMYRWWGHAGGLFTAPVTTGLEGNVGNVGYGNFWQAASDLNALLVFYHGFPEWTSSYTITHMAELPLHIDEFRKHLPIDTWRNRKGQPRCAVWIPTPIKGEAFPGPGIDPNDAAYESGYLDWHGEAVGGFLHPHHIKKVKTAGLTDGERTYTNFEIEWGFDKGKNRYLHKATCNPGAFDDGYGFDRDNVIFADNHKQLCGDVQERGGGIRTFTRQAPSVNRPWEAGALLMHYVRRYTKRHVLLELELDISVADMEMWQLVRFAPKVVLRETFQGMEVPYFGIDWAGDVEISGSEWWRVMRKFYDYDGQSVHVTLMHVAGTV